MKSKNRETAYDRFKGLQLAFAAEEDNMILLANELIQAKDAEGIDLFWDSEEEEFMRTIIDDFEHCPPC
ncbi:MAG: hypothetical protein ISR96_07000 [Nitrospira sp.]|nr:hypothetical protein [bacterium]MBL7049242.1 hypothetical protein [Nitrospira sp.]